MAFKHYSWAIDPRTKDYELSRGNPVRDESLAFPAYARLTIAQNSWLYAPDDEYGSQFHAVRKNDAATDRLLTSIATNALKPLLDDGRAESIVVNGADAARHGRSLQATIVGIEGEPVSIGFRPVGL